MLAMLECYFGNGPRHAERVTARREAASRPLTPPPSKPVPPLQLADLPGFKPRGRAARNHPGSPAPSPPATQSSDSPKGEGGEP